MFSLTIPLVQLSDRVFVRPDQVAAINVLGDQLVLVLVNGLKLPLGLGDLDQANKYSRQLADAGRHYQPTIDKKDEVTFILT